MPENIEQFVQFCRKVLTDSCFLLWEDQRPLAPTLKLHCLAYFQADRRSGQLSEKLPSEVWQRLEPHYNAMMEQLYNEFSLVADEELAAIYDRWFKNPI